jgi:hypothetical protein
MFKKHPFFTQNERAETMSISIRQVAARLNGSLSLFSISKVESPNQADRAVRWAGSSRDEALNIQVSAIH